MSMSRDGLLPRKFGKVHPKYKTPAFATIITGVIVGIPAIFTDLTEMADLTSIGTLFAFVIVSGGVIYIDSKKVDKSIPGGFRIPYVNSGWVLPVLWLVIPLLIWHFNTAGFYDFINLTCDWENNGLFAIFIPIALVISFFAIRHKWSLIPVLGLLTNLYLLSELGYLNWMRFIIWLIIGLAIYFAFGRKHSLLKKK